MGFFDENVKNILKNKLKDLEELELLLFINEPNSNLEQLLKELVELSDKLKLKILPSSDPLTSKYKVEFFPTVAVVGKNKGLIKFAGTPSGHEFMPFIQTLIEASKGDVDMPEELKEKIKSFSKPLHLMVFVTPMCPYCPGMVRLAHIMAILNENINAEGIEAMEFKDLSIQHNVVGVPKTVVNKQFSFEGMLPPDVAINKIKSFLK